jgi:hypothetical protein
MSDLLLRDARGSVISRYADPAERKPYHDERKPQPSDRQRCDLIAAERAWLHLKVIVECLDDVPPYALDRIESALESIRRGLGVKRRSLGMAPADQVAA